MVRWNPHERHSVSIESRIAAIKPSFSFQEQNVLAGFLFRARRDFVMIFLHDLQDMFARGVADAFFVVEHDGNSRRRDPGNFSQFLDCQDNSPSLVINSL